jgi:hypothetical protein
MMVRFAAFACAMTLSAAVGPAADAQGQPSRATSAPVVLPAAGVLPPDVAFGRFIALIRGHLLTGDELVAARQWRAAARHFGFPREEIYGIIRDDLRAYRTPPFEAALRSLVGVVKAQNPRQYSAARQKVEAALDAADAGLKARTSDWPRFVVKIAVEVLKSAPDEYEDAVAAGRIVRPTGYQSARGFILQADRMIEDAGTEFTGDSAAALADIRAGLMQLKRAFADVTAPRQAVTDSAAMLDIVSRIERAAGWLI